jgi:Protein of unknown function (DUF1496)
MHRLIQMLAFATCLGAALGPAWNTAWAAPESKPNANPVCLYESKTYSEGAFVCVQKSLILTCTADGDRVSWKPVADKDINDRCTRPTVQHYPERTRPPIHRRHFVHRAFPYVENPKCFVFNGREYCE